MSQTKTLEVSVKTNDLKEGLKCFYGSSIFAEYKNTKALLNCGETLPIRDKIKGYGGAIIVDLIKVSLGVYVLSQIYEVFK